MVLYLDKRKKVISTCDKSLFKKSYIKFMIL